MPKKNANTGNRWLTTHIPAFRGRISHAVLHTARRGSNVKDRLKIVNKDAGDGVAFVRIFLEAL